MECGGLPPLYESSPPYPNNAARNSPKRESILKALRMSRLNDHQIDEVILSVTEVSWRKVASVIIKVTDKMGSDLPEGDAGYNLVAKHIEILVRDGRLLAQGDIKKWRYSEVRKPN
jgi:hypothetical protein